MSEYLTLGPTPHDEVCTPNTGDPRKINLENKLYKEQLERLFKTKCPDVRFVVKSFPHDFGSYSEVCVEWYDAEGMAQAYDIESELPDKWDAEALEALAMFEQNP